MSNQVDSQPPDPNQDSIMQPHASTDEEHYSLLLYIAGATPHSIMAMQNIRKICEEHLKGRYNLQVIDIAQHPELAIPQNIVAIPTLIKELPLPLRRIIGNLSNTEKVLYSLGIVSEP